MEIPGTYISSSFLIEVNECLVDTNGDVESKFENIAQLMDISSHEVRMEFYQKCSIIRNPLNMLKLISNGKILESWFCGIEKFDTITHNVIVNASSITPK